MTADNTAVTATGAILKPFSVPMSARNTAENASGTKLPGLPVTADNTAVTATSAKLELFSIPCQLEIQQRVRPVLCFPSFL